MPDPKKLPYLLKLLEDESQLVQEAVLKELAAFGPSLEEELARLPEAMNAQKRQVLKTLLADDERKWLKQIWPSWFRLEGDREKLEAALTLLSEFQSGRHYPAKLKALLDVLSEEYQASTPQKDEATLADFLFKVKQLKGAEEDYYNPQNSNLIYVIEKKRGIPISLACVYILVGHRLGLNVEGCNFPGHFLARIRPEGHTIFVDCFNDGTFLEEKEILAMNTDSFQSLKEIFDADTDAETMMNRVLRNLVGAYQQAGDAANSYLMFELLNILERDRLGQTDRDDIRFN
ncbi:MAG: hypothetical protein HY590_04395 [Candidatus Omnitrophica bacterium]|nr:hypothetical protein [Candidatus Omnitrophota bacterium]